MRTVKRILKRLRLKRAGCNNESPLEQIAPVILEELEDSCGTFMGYRQLTRLLRRKYNLQVRRDTIMKSLRIIDPEGVERRKRHRLKRQRYVNPGSNYLWHVDGWDKLHVGRIKHLLDKKTLFLLINSFVFGNYFIVPQYGGIHLNVTYTNCSWYKILLPELY